MKRLNFEKFVANKIEKNELTKLRGGTHAQTTSSNGENDWRNCDSGETIFQDGSTGQGPTGGSNCV